MSKDDSLTLADTSVQATKALWEAAGYPEKYGLAFEEIIGLFDDEKYNSLKDIGKRTGKSGERIRQIYDEFFRESFGGQSRRSRWLDCMLEQRLAKLEQSELKLLEDPVMRTIKESAENAGCVVETIPYLDHGSASYACAVKSMVLVINGHRCSVHHPTAFSKSSPRSKRLYGRVQLCYKAICNTEGTIIYTNLADFPEHIFVIPSSVLRRVYFTPPSDRPRDLTLPAEKLPVYKNKSPRLDIWKYEDAWHLLLPRT